MAISNTSKMEKRMDTLFLEGGLEICIKEKKMIHTCFLPLEIYSEKKKKNISTNMNILELFINLKIWIKSSCPAMQDAK